MSPCAVHLPEALWHAAQEIAQAEETSLDDFILTAIAEKIAAARTIQYVRTRAARANPQAFRAVLARMQQVGGPVMEGDALEPDGGPTAAQA